MRLPFSRARRLAPDQSGTVAVEFALLAPIMITLFLCCMEVTNLVMTYLKLNDAVQTAVDLVALQQNPVATANISDFAVGAQDTMAPLSGANLKLAFASVVWVNGNPTPSTLGAGQYASDPASGSWHQEVGATAITTANAITPPTRSARRRTRTRPPDHHRALPQWPERHHRPGFLRLYLALRLGDTGQFQLHRYGHQPAALRHLRPAFVIDHQPPHKVRHPMPFPGNVPSLLRRLISERQGNIAIMFGLAAIPMVVAVGLAIDLSRGYAVRTRLNGALDNAGLALGSSPGSMTTAQLTARLQTYVYANYNSAALGSVGTPNFTVTNSGNTITVNGTASVPTTLMKLIGVNTMSVAATSVIIKGYTNLEVAMVLDVTGSMTCGDGGMSNCSQGVPPSHMDTLRTNALQAVNDLFSNQPTGTTLKIALVPYVTSVNIGLAAGANLGTLVPTTTPVDANGNPTYLDYTGAAIHDQSDVANDRNIQDSIRSVRRRA